MTGIFPNWLFVLGALGAASYAQAQDQQVSNIVFEVRPYIKADAGGRFDACGFHIGVEREPNSGGEAFSSVVAIVQNSNSSHSVLSVHRTITAHDNRETPTRSVLQWLRIGDLPPIALNPHDLITIPEDGLSAFTTFDHRGRDFFTPHYRGNNAIAYAVFFPQERMTRLYSGVFSVNQVVATQIQQCLTSLR